MAFPTWHHTDPDVRQALTRLMDALCSWERATGRTSILILREAGGYACRADSGKPLDETTQGDITDAQLMALLKDTARF